jgi:hypothetical protein
VWRAWETGVAERIMHGEERCIFHLWVYVIRGQRSSRHVLHIFNSVPGMPILVPVVYTGIFKVESFLYP